MKHLALVAALICLAGAAAADTEAGLAIIGDLGQLNGQALACGQTGAVAEAKTLVIQHAPKTRRYGEIFEEQTNAAFLSQGKGQQVCPTAADFAARLQSLSRRLQTALPVPQVATPQDTGR